MRFKGKLGWKRKWGWKGIGLEGKMELKRESGWQGNRGRMKYREARMGNGGEIGRWDHLQGTGLLKKL